ncbi:putative ribonuclease H-like domain-containing protein, partial [Tanacetum coccineum]
MTRNGPDWLFDVDSLTISMNYVPVVAGNQTNGIARTKDNIVAGHAQKEKESEQEYILIPLYTTDPLISQGPKDSEGDTGMKPTKVDEGGASDNHEKDGQDARSESERTIQKEKQIENTNSTNTVNTAGPSFDYDNSSPPVNTSGPSVILNVSFMDNTGIFGNAYDDEDVEEEVDKNNVDSYYTIPDAAPTKFLKDHPQNQVIGSLETHVQTRQMSKINEEHGLISSVQQLRRTNHKDFQNCLFACYLSQIEPKKPFQALKDPSWVEAMQDELLQFKLLKVWTLVDLPKDKWAIGTKWVFRNKKDERGIVVKNKARLVAEGHTQKEGIDYDEVFAPVARIESIRLFLAYASFKDFVVYQMDVKSAFLYGRIEKEVYVCQPPGFEDPHFPDKVYKVYVDDIIFGSTKKQMSNEFETLMHDKFQMSYMGELKIASTLMETNKALVKDEEVEDVDVHLYRSMIGSLMYFTASRPDIMFVVCTCARDLPFDLEAFSDSDYAEASLDWKSTRGGCQFLGKRLISWQCKKQTIVANSTTKAEHVAAANYYGLVLWIQNLMLA